MSEEKNGSTSQPRDERCTGEVANDTVLDYLWNPDAAHGPGHAQLNGGQPANKPQPNMPSTDELKDVLARYASWLNSWTDYD